MVVIHKEALILKVTLLLPPVSFNPLYILIHPKYGAFAHSVFKFGRTKSCVELFPVKILACRISYTTCPIAKIFGYVSYIII